MLSPVVSLWGPGTGRGASKQERELGGPRAAVESHFPIVPCLLEIHTLKNLEVEPFRGQSRSTEVIKVNTDPT